MDRPAAAASPSITFAASGLRIVAPVATPGLPGTGWDEMADALNGRLRDSTLLRGGGRFVAQGDGLKLEFVLATETGCLRSLQMGLRRIERALERWNDCGGTLLDRLLCEARRSAPRLEAMALAEQA